MDWLGGGDTLVQDSFIRASDDIFAMYGNWDGYSQEALTTPGREVANITIENSVLSTSISNVVRLGWPRKIFDSHNFTLRDSDVLHMGVGGCGVPFALFEIWADPGGQGRHLDIRLENIRLDYWYSLVQLRQPNPAIRDVTFTNIWAMDGPGAVPSVLKGDVSGVAFSGVDLGSGDVLKGTDLPIEIRDARKTRNTKAVPWMLASLTLPDLFVPAPALHSLQKGHRDWVIAGFSEMVMRLKARLFAMFFPTRKALCSTAPAAFAFY